jgi:hypothetical protein
MQGIVSKRGGLLDENSIEIVLAVAGIFILFMVLFALFSPSYDEADKIAESYFDRLGEAIESVDLGKKGSFFMLDYGEKGLKFYLISFGDKAVAEYDGKSFVTSASFERGLCVCSLEAGETSCDYCIDLEFPTDLDGLAGEGIVVTVEKEGGKYVFSKK